MATKIEQNTTNLQAVLDAVNALTENGSGGGGGLEIIEGTVSASFLPGSPTIYYTDEYGRPSTMGINALETKTLKIPKNTMVYCGGLMDPPSTNNVPEDDVLLCSGYMGLLVILRESGFELYVA